MPSDSLLSVLITAAAIGLAAFTQGFSGFGIGLVAMGLLALIAADAERATVLVSCVALVTMGALLAFNRRDMKVDWRSVLLLMVGIAPGFALGYTAVASFGRSPWFGLALGAALVAFSLVGLLNPRAAKPMPAWSAVPMGVLGGVLIGALTSGGPPLVIYLYSRQHDPREAKGTLQAIFLTTGLSRLALVHATGRPVEADMWLWIGVLGVFAAGMALLGHRLSRKLSAESFTRAVYVLIGATGLVNLIKSSIVLA